MEVVLSFWAVFLVATNQHKPEAYPTVQDYVAGIAAVQAPETNKIMLKKSSRADHPVILVMKRVGMSNLFCLVRAIILLGNKDVHLLLKRLVVAQSWHGCSVMSCKGAVAGRHPVPVEVASCEFIPLFTQFYHHLRWLIPVVFLICIQLNDRLMTSQLFVEVD